MKLNPIEFQSLCRWKRIARKIQNEITVLELQVNRHNVTQIQRIEHDFHVIGIFCVNIDKRINKNDCFCIRFGGTLQCCFGSSVLKIPTFPRPFILLSHSTLYFSPKKIPSWILVIDKDMCLIHTSSHLVLSQILPRHGERRWLYVTPTYQKP